MTGGVMIPLILLQAASTGNDSNTTIILAVLSAVGAAGSALFGALVISYKGRVDDKQQAWDKSDKNYDSRLNRCETREDKLLADTAASKDTIKDLSSSVLKVAGFAEQAVSIGQAALAASQQNKELISEGNRTISGLISTVRELQRAMDDAAYERGEGRSSPRRRSGE